jgi:ketosteroid isomerase-like protein
LRINTEYGEVPKMKTFLAFLLLLPLSATAQTATPDLLKTDRDFATAVSERGVEGWMGFMSENAVLSMWGNLQPFAGQAAILNYLTSQFAIRGLTVTLTPESAFLSPSGHAGYTTGTYEWARPNNPANPLCRCTTGFRGTYVTAWRLADDGKWRVKSFTILEEYTFGCGCFP